jgi:hypothetical protein
MRRLSSAIVTLSLLALAGCNSGDHHQKAGKDMCSHCSGTQALTSKGTCEKCGMAMDVCAACPGTQTLTDSGHCSGCGGKVVVGA